MTYKVHWLVSSFICLVAWGAPVAWAGEFDAAASKVAEAIGNAGLERVSVLPVLFLENRLSYGDNKPARLTSSPHSSMYAEQFELALVDAGAGKFRLIPSQTALESLRTIEPKLNDLSANSPAFRQLPSKVEGGLDALVVGTIREREFDPSSSSVARDVAWKLVDLTDGSIRVGRETSGVWSLADEVYNGRSHEFYRPRQNRYWAVGFGFSTPRQDKLPLHPLDSLEYFQLTPNSRNDAPHPVFNPKCPFKATFLINGQERSLLTAASRDSDEIVGVSDPAQFNLNDTARRKSPLGSGNPVYDNNAFLPVQPGEQLTIKVRNDSDRRVMVAVYIDGINTLGKRRELPDQNCRVWSLAAGEAGEFQGWYSGPQGQEQREDFVVGFWEDSVAGKLGQKDHVGMITVVFFSEGMPRREQMGVHPREFAQQAWWSPNAGRILVDEGVRPPLPKGTFATGMPDLAMGGKRPQPHPLKYGDAGSPGVILTGANRALRFTTGVPGATQRHTRQFTGR